MLALQLAPYLNPNPDSSRAEVVGDAGRPA